MWLFLRNSTNIQNSTKVLQKDADNINKKEKVVRMLEISLLDLGETSLKFYAYQTVLDFERGFPISLNSIYWKSAAYPKGFGPFNNLSDAVDHHNRTIKEGRARPLLVEMNATVKVEPISGVNNVMYVDFTSKKRLN